MARKTLKRKNIQNKVQQQQAVVSNIEDVVPVDKHLLTQVPVSAQPAYTPDYIEPWESWNPRRWGKWDYSDYPTEELANISALKKLGANQDYVYKKQILDTKAEEEKKKQDPGTSSTYDEAFNKYYNFIKENEGSVKDKKTGLFIPYPSPEDDGTYTVGYGHKLKKGQENNPMFKNGLTEEQAAELFKNDFQTHYKHAKKFMGKEYFNALPYDQQMMLTDYNFNTKKGLPGFPKFVSAIKAYNDASTEEEKEAQRRIIAEEYTRKYDDSTPLYQRNNRTLDNYLIPSFKIKKVMANPEKYTHPGIPDPNWIYGAVQPIDDNRGQWAYPGEVTRINASAITMAGVPYPVLGVGADGEQRMMYPNEEHTFNEAPVTEYPMMQAKHGGWLTAYKDGGTSDYDMLGYATHHPLGALKHMINPERFHGTDEYKRPNHMTFSDESKYSNTEHTGGHWEQLENGKWTFTPTEFNIQNAGGPEKYQQWWDETEGKDGNILILPQHKRGGVTWLNEYAEGGKTFSAGGEKHKVYKKESPTGNGKGIEGHIMVTHPTTDKGKWDTIDLTKIAGAKTVAQGVAATKKWHEENPEYQNGGYTTFLSPEHQFLQSIYSKPTNERNQYLESKINQFENITPEQYSYTPRYTKSQKFSMPTEKPIEIEDSFLDDLIFRNHHSDEKPAEETKEVLVEPTATTVTETTKSETPAKLSDKPQANKVSDKLMTAFQRSAEEYKKTYPNRPTPVISSGFRSREKQEQLYANRGNNPFPVAKPGTSKHEHGLAIDVGFTGAHTDQDYANFAAIMNKNGVKWLGSSDKVHFQLDEAAYGGWLNTYE